jgi:hypothetical protein
VTPCCLRTGDGSNKHTLACTNRSPSLSQAEFTNIIIESYHPKPDKIIVLGNIPVTSLRLASMLVYQPGDWKPNRYLEALEHLPSLHTIDLGTLQVTPRDIQLICTTVTGLISLSVLSVLAASNADIAAALEYARDRLRTLSLKRVPQCMVPDLHGPAIDLRPFISLQRLSMSSSFLLQPATSLPPPYGPPSFLSNLSPSSRLRTHIPTQLTLLTLYFEEPNFFLARNVQGSPVDLTEGGFGVLVGYFEGMGTMEVVECGRKYDGLRVGGEVKEYKFCGEEKRRLGEAGTSVRLWVSMVGGIVVRDAR